MKRLTPVTAAILALAAPASALAAGPSRGVVLSVNQSRHSIEVVDASHVVHGYSYRGRLTGVHAGSVVSFRQSGAGIAGVHVAGSTRTVSYFANVVRSSGKHVVLRLADGRTVSFAAHQVKGHGKSHGRKVRKALALAHAASAGGVTININGLAPGSTVLVTETTNADGSITISITLPASGTGATTGGTAGDQSVSGVVSDVQDDTFTITTGDGSTLLFHMNADALSNVDMYPCDTVDVSYHQDSGVLVADNVDDNGTSDTGACAGSSDGSDETGAITKMTASSVTIDTSDNGPMTFSVDPTAGLLDGFLLGDVVDVTYADGNVASDVEYVENDATGVVTAVTAGTITFTDDQTGATDTFAADPAQEVFDGVAVGDTVDVTSHQALGQSVVDNVDDLTADESATSGSGSGD